jgi:hypothetical protein
MPPGTPDDAQPPAEPLSHAAHQLPPRPPTIPVTPKPTGSGLQRRSVLRAALLAGALAGLGSLVPFMPFILLCMVACGGMSIAFYTRREPHQTVTAGGGLRIGSLAGMFGFFINATLSTVSMLSANSRAAMRGEMMNRLKEAMASSSDPAATDMLRRLGDQLNSPSGLAMLFTFALLVLAVLFVVFGGLGGAIGATLFGRRQEPEQQ